MAGVQRVLGRIPHSVTERLPSKLAERIDRSVIGVVRLHGVITPAMSPMARSVLNLSVVEPVLRRAFDTDRLAAVALQINSPGGAATQSALIADLIRGLAEEHEVPVLAFCEDVAASGGYWLACAADEIYAHPTSMVGSIGVISGGFGMVGLLERIGVERRLHTAGACKSRLDPFLPEKPDDVEWLTGLQTELHQQFQDWVRTRRGAKLVGGADELFTGEVWTGAAALSHGLVDGLGTLREILADRFPDAEPVAVEGRKPLLAKLGLAGMSSGGGVVGGAALGAGAFEELLSLAEARAAWARFGL
ncbi:MAG: S49 family peptidase [Actinomycetota bacterium]|nr:S49 family peptidase [Actinomycetota bacterium]